MYWITSSGIDYLTSVIDKSGTSRYTKKNEIEESILGALENEGGGFSPSQLWNQMETHEWYKDNPIDRVKYTKVLLDLVKRGFIIDLS